MAGFRAHSVPYHHTLPMSVPIIPRILPALLSPAHTAGVRGSEQPSFPCRLREL